MQKLPEGNPDSLAVAHKTVGSFSHLKSPSDDEYFGTQELVIGKPKMALVLNFLLSSLPVFGNLSQGLKFSFLIDMLNDDFQNSSFY